MRESTSKLKSNGIRRSAGSATVLVRTPESVTLSVGSLPQRQMYPSSSSNPWRSPSSEHLDDGSILDPMKELPPPMYKEAVQQVDGRDRDQNRDRGIMMSVGSMETDDSGAEDDKEIERLVEEVPPPVPPHRIPVRPRSAMSIGDNSGDKSSAMATIVPGTRISTPRYYDEVSMEWRGSRERLLMEKNRGPAPAAANGLSNRLHRSVGSGLEQTFNIKSPSSSDSSRKKNTAVMVIPSGSADGLATQVQTVTPPTRSSSGAATTRGQMRPPPQATSYPSPFWDAMDRRSTEADMLPSKKTSSSSTSKHNNIKLANRAVDPNILSSPEYPSTSSDVRRHTPRHQVSIPQPPPPPKVYWVAKATGGQAQAQQQRHHYHPQRNPHLAKEFVVTQSNRQPVIIAQHGGQPPQQQHQLQQGPYRRHHHHQRASNAHYVTDDSDV